MSWNKTKRTPLQKWAWERFRFKGSVTATRELLKNHAMSNYTAPFERIKLLRVIKELNLLMAYWADSQAETRKEVVKKSG